MSEHGLIMIWTVLLTHASQQGTQVYCCKSLGRSEVSPAKPNQGVISLLLCPPHLFSSPHAL